jgi:heptosyltransferase-2
MALPAVADVRRAWPGAAVAVAARPSIAPLFSLAPGVNEVVVLPGSGAPASEVADALRGHSFDAAILLPNSFHIALAAKRAGIRERWGYRADWRGPLLTRAVARPSHLHQAEYYQTLTAALGCAMGPMHPELTVPEDARQAAYDLLRAAGWDGRAPLVALAPGAAYGGAKRWPASSFADVATELSSHDGAESVLIGAPADAGAGSDVEARVKSPVINLIGRTDLRALAGVLVACRALVTNDSGAMHFAAALGVPVTAMFGPTREKETRPLAREGSLDPVVLTHHVWCRPCMRGITVASVLAAARRSL